MWLRRSPFPERTTPNMAALYLLLACLHAAGAVRSSYTFDDVVLPGNRWWEKRPLPQEMSPWDYYRRYYDFDLGRIARPPSEVIKHDKSLRPIGWLSEKDTGSAQDKSMPTEGSSASPENYWFEDDLPKEIPSESIRSGSKKRFEANEEDGSSIGLGQPVDASQPDNGVEDPQNRGNTVKRMAISTIRNEEITNDRMEDSAVGEGKASVMTEDTPDVEKYSTVPEETELPDLTVEAKENGTSENEMKKGANVTTSIEGTNTTETVPKSSGLEETPTPSVHDKVDERIDLVNDSSSGGSPPSSTLLPSSTVTTSKIVSTSLSTTDGNSTEGTPSSTTRFPTSTVTVNETVSSTFSTVDGSSTEGIPSSTTRFPASTVTVSETVSSILSTVDDSSVEGTSSSTTRFPTVTVTVSETVSSTLSTRDGGSTERTSSSTTSFPTSTVTAIPEHDIVMPKIRTAKIVISSVLLAIGLVAVAVIAVYIFREKRKAVKYDQLKLLP